MSAGQEIRGIHTCKECKRDIKWLLHIGGTIDTPGLLKVVTYAPDVAVAQIIDKSDPSKYLLKVRCMSCDAVNQFDHIR